MPRDLFAEAPAAPAPPRDLFAAQAAAPAPRDLFAGTPHAAASVAAAPPAPAIDHLPTPADVAGLSNEQLATMAPAPSTPPLSQQLAATQAGPGQQVVDGAASAGRDLFNVGKKFVARQEGINAAHGEQILDSRGMDADVANRINYGNAVAGIGINAGLDMPAIPMTPDEKQQALAGTQRDRDAAAQREQAADAAIQNPVIRHVGGAAATIAPFMVAGPAAPALAFQQSEGSVYDAAERTLRERNGGVSTPENRNTAAGGGLVAGGLAGAVAGVPGGSGLAGVAGAAATGAAFTAADQTGLKVATGQPYNLPEIGYGALAGVAVHGAMKGIEHAAGALRGEAAPRDVFTGETAPQPAPRDLFAPQTPAEKDRTAAALQQMTAPQPAAAAAEGGTESGPLAPPENVAASYEPNRSEAANRKR
jgi:hypothetical protein